MIRSRSDLGRPVRSARAWAVAAAMLVACRPATDQPAAATEEEQPTRLTLWSDSTELYLEYPPMVEGLPAKFAVHLTDLTDFRPVAAGTIVLRFRPTGGGAGFEATAEAPTSPGIYGPVVTAAAAGEYTVDLILRGRQANDSLRLPPMMVHSEDGDIPLGSPLGAGIAFLKEQQWQTAGFRTAFATAGRLRGGVEVSGEIGAAAGRDAMVAAPVAGILEPAGLRAAPVPGQWVRSGQALAILTPTLVDGGGYPAARARFQEAEHEHARAKRLVEAEAAPARRLEDATIRLDAARAELASFGTPDSSDASGRITLRAPIAGMIVDRRAIAGSQVNAGATLFSIIDPSVVWLTARVPAHLVTAIGPSPRGRFTVDGEAGTWSTIRLLAASPTVDSLTRTVALVFEAANRDRRLRIGATARILLERGSPEDGTIVPAGAVIEEDGRPIGYVQVSGERFERRELEIGARQGDQLLIRRGIAPGERVVVGGAYQVRLASLSTAVPDHGHEH
ncbi:MAG: efflux RND transporter periplasmic adaptor subunit [Gemmatimonadales bacterium]